MSSMIYLDHAATGFPKPPRVVAAVERCLRDVAGSPARGGHAGVIDANRLLYTARARAAELLDVGDSARIVLTSGATYAINLALAGTLHAGDHLITTDMEHNGVARPLTALGHAGVALTRVRHEPDPERFLAGVAAALRPNTRWLVVNHASNVNGQTLDLEAVAGWCVSRGLRLGVDAAQSAGLLDLHVDPWSLGWLACSGHKALHGPQGTGILAVGAGVEIEPLIRGGTGSHSDSDQQPGELPESLESGTPNTPGIAGLAEGLAHVLEHGTASLHARALGLARRLADGLALIDGVEHWGPGPGASPVPVVSFRIRDQDPSLTATRLEDDRGIRCRVGLHCAPAAHRRLGTFPIGTVRASPGPTNTELDVDTLVGAVAEVTRG